MLCLYMAVSAQPRRRIPFKRLGGCHSDSRLSSCPTLAARSAASPARQIYICSGLCDRGRGETLALAVLRGVCFQRNI